MTPAQRDYLRSLQSLKTSLRSLVESGADRDRINKTLAKSFTRRLSEAVEATERATLQSIVYRTTRRRINDDDIPIKLRRRSAKIAHNAADGEIEMLERAIDSGRFDGETAYRYASKRIILLFRNTLNRVRQDAFWAGMGRKAVRGKIAFLEYKSAHRPGTRPSHAAMHGFLAVPEDKIWEKIRPLNGFGCCCDLSPVSFSAAEFRGLLTNGGIPKFTKRWPNSMSRINFERGRFPDPGWGKGEK